MILVTYLPFYRMYEVEEYFDKSVEAIRPDRSLVYLDNIFNERQIEIAKTVVKHELKVGNWGNRGSTWFSMLKDIADANDTVVFVDSDNILNSELKAIDKIIGDNVYTILDTSSWERGAVGIMKRSRKGKSLDVDGKKVDTFIYKVYDSSIFSTGSNFFIGAKQAVGFRQVPEKRIIDGVERAFTRVQHDLRRYVSDETVLGVMIYLMGIREVRWFVCSQHYHHGSTPSSVFKPFVALAHAQFARGLYSEFKMNEFLRYWVKYKMAFVRGTISVVF
ncbi:MAG: hypothetical protein QW431_02930 [Conexivisphaerales archaeon]